MVRNTNAPVTKKRRKKILKEARGYFGNNSRLFKYAKIAVIRSKVYSYIDRKKRKSYFRSYWIKTININARLFGWTYSKLLYCLKTLNLLISRKLLSILSRHNLLFKSFIDFLSMLLSKKLLI